MRQVDLYDDPALYDVLRPRVERWDGPFYLELAREGGRRVLELACGNGHLLGYLADNDDFDLVGLDLSPLMLADAKVRVPDARLVQDDMRTFDLGEKFDLIFIGLNSLLHMTTTADLLLALERVRAHLAEGGLFAFNIFNPDPGYLARAPDARFHVAERTHPRTGQRVLITETTSYDRVRQIQTTKWYYGFDGEPETVSHDLVVRVIFPEELLLLLETAGLEVVHRYGDLRRWPFDHLAEHQVIVARARQEDAP